MGQAWEPGEHIGFSTHNNTFIIFNYQTINPNTHPHISFIFSRVYPKNPLSFIHSFLRIYLRNWHKVHLLPRFIQQALRHIVTRVHTIGTTSHSHQGLHNRHEVTSSPRFIKQARSRIVTKAYSIGTKSHRHQSFT